MTAFQKIRYIVFIIFLIVVSIVAFLYFREVRERKKSEEVTRRMLFAKEEEWSKIEYKKALVEICSNPLTEATASELYYCKDLKSSKGLIQLGFSPEMATGSADLPAYCQRKIMEMTMLELLECLEPTPSEEGP